MHQYISVLILMLGFSYSLFSQGTQLELDTFNRSIPTANFGGQTWRGPSWVDNVFNDSVATMHPDVLGYPPCADVWDWQNGWFYSQSVLDTCPLDTIVLSWGQLNASVISITPENFQNALNQIGAEGLYCLNMISSSITQQLSDLHSAKANGVYLERIRLGDEMGKAGNELSISHFPTAEDYAVRCEVYIDSIRNILPNTKIAVSAGNYGGNSNPRAEYWNEALYDMINKADAFRWSAFFYLKDADTVFTTKQLLAYAFDQIPTYEKVRGFKDTISNLQNYELWVGYGITDNTVDHRYLNRWSQVLMFSASHHVFLNNKLVEDISMFNVGGIFENWEALDTQNDFRKRATGIFATIWNKAKLNKNRATKIETPITLIDTVTYFSNNIPRNTEYPKLFGWRFENDSTLEASVILTNISKDTLIVSVDGFLVGDVSWQKWHSDSLFDLIDSINYINLLRDTGLTNIILLPYSINVAAGNVCNHLVYNSEVSICVGDSALVSTSVYSAEGVYTDSMINMYGCDSVIITDLDFYIQNAPIISMSSFALETELAMNNYQWYLDGDSISGANQFNFSPSIIGNYTVSYLNDNDCFLFSNVFLYELVEVNNECKRAKQLLKIIDILGREVDSYTNIDNTTLFYIYDDGAVVKKIVIDKRNFLKNK